MTLAYNPGASSPVIQSITYSVTTTGDAMFPSTIGSTDSPDYTADKVEANTQCVALNPLATERVA
tara:strand:+ start:1009 stop:1203 length:195 start_codon:yes stop_codon:yes gene_type:complete